MFVLPPETYRESRHGGVSLILPASVFACIARVMDTAIRLAASGQTATCCDVRVRSAFHHIADIPSQRTEWQKRAKSGHCRLLHDATIFVKTTFDSGFGTQKPPMPLTVALHCSMVRKPQLVAPRLRLPGA